MNNNRELMKILKAYNIDYCILKNINEIENLSHTYRDINVIVGVRGRDSLLITCLKYLKKSAENTNIAIKITAVEQDNESHYKDICKTFNIDHIFVPNNFIRNGNFYNRSFCFNAGFLLSFPSPWYLFNDVDILVNESFFNKIQEYLKKNPKWLQTYTNKRVLLFNKDTTETIINHPFCFDLSVFKEKRDYNPAAIGSTGGSILVRRDMFLKAGGFDPEFFYGYGPEDSFFWSKLEALEKRIDEIDGHFAGGGMFADDPPIEVFHMYHEPTYNSNPKERMMLGLRKHFWQLKYEEKLKIIHEKEKILAQALECLKA